MQKSKTQIQKQLSKKKNPELVETIILAKKNSKWIEIASILSGPTRKKSEINLDYIDKNSKPGEIIAIPGKVLSVGEITKKIRICALNFSDKAKEKLLKANCELKLLKDEIKENKDAKGVKILK
ncbi:MAG: 50S ribosomal protein L18e [Candidatus Pacearchaeota archaeon]|jgi:large subunit ribosomal protein L18e